MITRLKLLAYDENVGTHSSIKNASLNVIMRAFSSPRHSLDYQNRLNYLDSFEGDAWLSRQTLRDE